MAKTEQHLHKFISVWRAYAIATHHEFFCNVTRYTKPYIFLSSNSASFTFNGRTEDKTNSIIFFQNGFGFFVRAKKESHLIRELEKQRPKAKLKHI